MATALEVMHESGERWVISRDGAVIGRSAAVDVPVTDASASREHARLRRKGDDFELENLSPNGTLVNGKPVTARLLRDGDMIELGAQTKLRVRYLTQATTVVSHFDQPQAGGTDAFAEDGREPASPAAPRPSLFRRPKVIIGLSLYFVVIIALWIMLATSPPPYNPPPHLGREEIARLLEDYFAPDSAAFPAERDLKQERRQIELAREAFNTAPVSVRSLWQTAYAYRKAVSHRAEGRLSDTEDERHYREARRELARRVADRYEEAQVLERRGRLDAARGKFAALREIISDRTCPLTQHLDQWISAINVRLAE